MNITPLDIQQISFKVGFRGYDRMEVDSFLQEVSEDYESYIRENASLKEKLAEFEIQVLEMKKKESSLNNTLMKVQELTEKMKENAHKEAELIVREGELKAEQIIGDARKEFAQIQGEINSLKREKIIFIGNMRSLLSSLQKIIEMEEVEIKEKDMDDENPSSLTKGI
ncbi:MAG: DivIVA domain-containing protein [Nitrospirota bacterium]